MGLRSGAIVVGVAIMSLAGGCTSLLGDFSSGGAASDGGTPLVDAHVTPDATGSSSSSSGGGSSSGASSSGGDEDSGGSSSGSVAILPGVPGKPGTDITAGGNTSSSPSYTLVGAVGESTGSNVVSTSTHYTLNGGVIVGTSTP